MTIAEIIRTGGMLSLGSTGPGVAAVQEALARLGYKLRVPGTGYFGGDTDTSVRDFQILSRLDPIDGVVGTDTAAALDAAQAPVERPVIAHVGRPVWLLTGLQYLKLKEGAGSHDNPEIMRWALEEGGAIARDYTHDSIPWCALFANIILTKNGIKGTETLWALDFNSPSKWPCVKLSGPAVGAFAPMVRDGGGHITIVAGRTLEGYIAGLGGNQSDAVTIASFPVGRPLNYWWPLGQPLPQLTGFKTLPIVSSAGITLSAQEA